MTDTRRLVVVGGSIAGLFTGVLFRRRGWQVDIVERAGRALESRGAGITTHDELYRALEDAGVSVNPELAVTSSGRVFLDAAGNVAGRLDMPQRMTSWGLLYRLLRSRFPDDHYHMGAQLDTLDDDGSEVTATLTDGRALRGDFLVGTDGLRSTVRARVMPEAEPRYAGYTAWRGLANEADLPAEVRALTGGRFTLCLPPGEHVLGYLVAGPGDTVAPGKRWYNWVWYRPADDTRLRELLTGSDGTYYPHGIPHHLIQPRWVTQMRDDAARLVAPQLRAAIERSATPFLQPIQDLVSPRMVNGRVIVIGDAAFTPRPHIGLGVSKAAEDAATLARVFDSDPAAWPARLAAWEDARVAWGRATVAHSARLGCYLDGTAPADAREADMRAFYRKPDIVMSHVAARDPRAVIGRAQ